MSLLTLQNLTASYGSSQALFGVNLTLQPSKVLALMGRNGMGKSTTVKAICRLLPSQGLLRFDGKDLSALASHQAARLGIGLVPEGRRCFTNLTVTENLIASARPGHWNVDRIAALFPRLKERKDQNAGTLSGGEQQMLAIGRALLTNPRLLILDEATEGLAPLVRQEIWDAIAHLKAETGMAILIIDKSVPELSKICDSAVILERGKTAWMGPITELTPEVTQRHIGL